MIRVFAVPPDDVADAVKTLGRFVEQIFSRGSGGCDPFRLVRKACRNEAVMWVIADDKTPLGVAFTQTELWIEGKRLRIVGVAGSKMRTWLKTFTDEMKKHGRDEGCEKLVGEGRPGWGRVLGLKPVRTVIEMEID